MKNENQKRKYDVLKPENPPPPPLLSLSSIYSIPPSHTVNVMMKKKKTSPSKFHQETNMENIISQVVAPRPANSG